MFPEITRDDIFRLETKRLWLRWPRAADAEAFARYAGDPEVALKTASIPYPYSLHHAESFILDARRLNAAGDGLFLALTPKRRPDDAIGLVSLRGAAVRGASEFGYWLGKPHWGQGLMAEAGRAVVDFAFGVASIDQIVSSALPTNAASLRVQEKLGFTRTGEAVHPAPARGGELDVVTTALKRGAAHGPFCKSRPKMISTGVQ